MTASGSLMRYRQRPIPILLFAKEQKCLSNLTAGFAKWLKNMA